VFVTPFEKSATQEAMNEGGMGFAFDGGSTFGADVGGVRLSVPAETMLSLYELAEEFRSTVARAEELGFSAARSAGMEMPTDPFIFLDEEQGEDAEFQGFRPGGGGLSIEDRGIHFKLFDRSGAGQVAAYVEIDEIERYLRDVGLLPGGTPRM